MIFKDTDDKIAAERIYNSYMRHIPFNKLCDSERILKDNGNLNFKTLNIVKRIYI